MIGIKNNEGATFRLTDKELDLIEAALITQLYKSSIGEGKFINDVLQQIKNVRARDLGSHSYTTKTEG